MFAPDGKLSSVGPPSSSRTREGRAGGGLSADWRTGNVVKEGEVGTDT